MRGSVFGVWKEVEVRGSVGRGEGKVWGEWKNVGGGVRKCVGVWRKVWEVCRGVGRGGGMKRGKKGKMWGGWVEVWEEVRGGVGKYREVRRCGKVCWGVGGDVRSMLGCEKCIGVGGR